MQRISRTITTALLLVVLFTVYAQAGRFNPGDRPSNISGREVGTNRTITLEDFKGKWVLIDFFATWCGPCMGELPNLVKTTKPLIGQNFTVLGVSLDTAQTMDKLRPVMKDKGISYPVVFPGFGWDTPPAKEWGVTGIPDTYLISPQGVVVATDLRGEALGETLHKFMNLGVDNYAVQSVSASHKLEGSSFSVSANFNNPVSAQTKCKLELSFEIGKKDKDGQVTSYETQEKTEEALVDTPSGWETTKDFNLELPADCEAVFYTFSVWNSQVETWIGVSNYAFVPKPAQ